MEDRKKVVSVNLNLRRVSSVWLEGNQTIKKKKPKKILEDQPHRFDKKTFQQPTWCEFAQSFIWGLDKTGYECRICHLTVSRRFIGIAKDTICGEVQSMEGKKVNAEACRNRVFTVYLSHGAKKSVLFNPMEPLQTTLEKICLARGLNMDDFVAQDSNGQIVELTTILAKIPGQEITFTPKMREDSSSSIPPLKSSKRASAFVRPKVEEKTRDRIASSPASPKYSGSPKLRVIDSYDYGGDLGAGAFSVVRAAKHKLTGNIVAIKILDKYEDDEEQTEKFRSEIKILSNLKHDNIVEFLELDEDDVHFYVVMELVDGGELFDYIIQQGCIPEIESACIISQVLKAVEYLHSMGIAHRDLKPENLLFKGKDHKVIKLADFGESKSFKEGNLTTYCGTPDYMAPEIINGDPYNCSVDIWSIGVITYVMLAGFPPFDGENDVQVFASILSNKYSFPSPEWNNITNPAKDFIRSIFVTASKRLTATECLNHAWITENVSPEMRTNRLVTVASLNKIKPLEEEDRLNDSSLDMKNSKSQLLEIINDLMEIANAHPEYQTLPGELRTISSVVAATSGNTTDFENTIYELYWDRLKDLKSLLLKNIKSPSTARTLTGTRKEKNKQKKL